jgi:hypothetical protein
LRFLQIRLKKISKIIAKAFKNEFDWIEVLSSALFVATVLKINYLVLEELYFSSIFWKLVFGKKFK